MAETHGGGTAGDVPSSSGEWYARSADQPFKCIEPFCKEGWEFGKYHLDRGTVPGEWFPAGTLRTARKGPSSNWEQFCPSHIEAGKRRKPGDLRAFPPSSRPASSAATAATTAATTAAAPGGVAGAASSRIVDTHAPRVPGGVQGAATAATTAAAAAAAAAAAGDGAVAGGLAAANPPTAAAPACEYRPVKKRGRRSATTSQASLDRNQSLLRARFPNQAPLPKTMDGEPDRSPRPPQRTQRHETMPKEEAFRMVDAVLVRYRDRLPMPSATGGLEPVPTAAELSNPPQRSQAEATAVALRRVEQAFGEYGPYIPLGSAPTRARKHKPTGFPWTSEMKKRALQEFHVNGTFVPIMPEVFFRRAMLADSRFTVKDAKGDVIGVRLICQCCRSNRYTKTGRSWTMVRAVHDVSGTNLFVQARRHSCLNPRCRLVRDQVAKSAQETEKRVGAERFGAEVASLTKRAVTAEEVACLRDGRLDKMQEEVAEAMVAAFARKGVGFSINTPQYMKLLPAEVQQGYSFVLLTVGGASQALLEKTVIGMLSSSALQRELQEVYDYQQTRMMLQYAAFTQTEGAHEGGGKWPAFRPAGRGSLLSAPSYSNLETYCDHKFTEVEPHMHALVCSRHPGTNMSFDGTYKIAKMCHGAAKVAMIVMGELGDIIGYAFAESESWSNLLPFWAGLANRFERLGKKGVLKTAKCLSPAAPQDVGGGWHPLDTATLLVWGARTPRGTP